MKMYCNARLPVVSEAHYLDPSVRAEILEKWISSHTDEEIRRAAKRKKPVSPRDESVSIAISLSPRDSDRLTRILDGRLLTFSSLARSVFEKT